MTFTYAWGPLLLIETPTKRKLPSRTPLRHTDTDMQHESEAGSACSERHDQAPISDLFWTFLFEFSNVTLQPLCSGHRATEAAQHTTAGSARRVVSLPRDQPNISKPQQSVSDGTRSEFGEGSGIGGLVREEDTGRPEVHRAEELNRDTIDQTEAAVTRTHSQRGLLLDAEPNRVGEVGGVKAAHNKHNSTEVRAEATAASALT